MTTDRDDIEARLDALELEVGAIHEGLCEDVVRLADNLLSCSDLLKDAVRHLEVYLQASERIRLTAQCLLQHEDLSDSAQAHVLDIVETLTNAHRGRGPGAPS